MDDDTPQLTEREKLVALRRQKRQQRLAKALRENLRKRKEQKRNLDIEAVLEVPKQA